MNTYITYFTFATIIQVDFCHMNYHDKIHHENIVAIEGDYFVNQFIVVIDGDEDEAREIARETNFEYKRKLDQHENYYHFTYPESDIYDRHRLKREDLVEILKNHAKVISADQQYVSLPTLNELDIGEFKDVVCVEEPRDVKISQINPEEISYKGVAANELIQSDDIFEDPRDDDYYIRGDININFDELYEERDRLMRERDKSKEVIIDNKDKEGIIENNQNEVVAT